MEKKKVEIYNAKYDAVYERFLLSDEQLRLLELMEKNDYLAENICVNVLEEDITFQEV